ncbi:18644_t:CDS:2, partial [Gigaspora rosea]
PAASTSASALVASTSSNSTSLDASTSFISNKKVSTKNSRITNYITSDRISKTEQKLLELEFARSIFQCGLFLSLPKMEPIKKLWKKARPAFRLPSRKKLSTNLLNKIYNETKKNAETLINNSKNLCLVSDGWSNLVQEHWTNYILTTPKPVFYTAHPTNEIRQNSETIAYNLEKIITKGSLATCFNSLVRNQLALKLAIIELAHDNHTALPYAVSETINCENFWVDIESLLIVLDKLVAVEKNLSTVMPVAHLLDPRYCGRKLPANGMSTISTFIQNLAWNAVNEVDLVAWWKGNFKESLPELCNVASRILTIPSSSAAAERNWSNFSYIHDKKRSRLTPPRRENNQFELLDPSSDDEESSRNELIEDDEDEIVESSESEIESTTENDTDSESK